MLVPKLPTRHKDQKLYLQALVRHHRYIPVTLPTRGRTALCALRLQSAT
jgi:hypothetical protein